MRRLDYATPRPSQPFRFNWASLLVIFVVMFLLVSALLAREDLLQPLLPIFSNGLFLAAWMLSAFGVGIWIVRTVGLVCAPALRVVVAMALGFGFLSLAVLGLGCAGL